MTTDELIGLVLLLMIATGTAHSAAKRGLNWQVWFFLTMLFGPVATLVLNCRKKWRKRKERPVKKIPHALWFYLDEVKKQSGPVSSKKLREMILEKRLGNHSYVWKEGMEEWKKIQDTPLKVLDD
ncbi:MAG: DUF4339 domain-containing protein [Chlamydiota bacterium]